MYIRRIVNNSSCSGYGNYRSVEKKFQNYDGKSAQQAQRFMQLSFIIFGVIPTIFSVEDDDVEMTEASVKGEEEATIWKKNDKIPKKKTSMQKVQRLIGEIEQMDCFAWAPLNDIVDIQDYTNREISDKTLLYDLRNYPIEYGSANRVLWSKAALTEETVKERVNLDKKVLERVF